MKDDAAIKFSNVKVSEGTLQQQLESVRSGRCDKVKKITFQTNSIYLFVWTFTIRY